MHLSRLVSYMEIQPPSDSPAASPLPAIRGYQQEMLEESLRKNLIIALDTGSGKTLIAILRMKIEAEREAKKVKLDPSQRRYITYNLFVGLLVSCPYCRIMRSAKICDIASTPGICRSDFWFPGAKPMDRSWSLARCSRAAPCYGYDTSSALRRPETWLRPPRNRHRSSYI
jgi:hypothetical protein